jgi:exonuclease III
VKIVNWNVQSASAARAETQVQWLNSIAADVVVLTEVPKGGDHHYALLCEAGFDVLSPAPCLDSRVIIAVRVGRVQRVSERSVTDLPHRALECAISCGALKFAMLGVYVPSRGPAHQRNVRKRSFQNDLETALRQRMIDDPEVDLLILGDLNVVEPDHQPEHKVFGQWEYDFYRSFDRAGLVDVYRLHNSEQMEHSWIGRSGNGYRFDHAFASENVARSITRCFYDHSPRLMNLSDHSAMILEVRTSAS